MRLLHFSPQGMFCQLTVETMKTEPRGPAHPHWAIMGGYVGGLKRSLEGLFWGFNTISNLLRGLNMTWHALAPLPSRRSMQGYWSMCRYTAHRKAWSRRTARYLVPNSAAPYEDSQFFGSQLCIPPMRTVRMPCFRLVKTPVWSFASATPIGYVWMKGHKVFLRSRRWPYAGSLTYQHSRKIICNGGRII